MSPDRRPRNLRLLAAAFIALLTLIPGAIRAQDPTPAGRVKTASGTAFVVNDGERKAAEVGDPVFENGVLETGADGTLGVVFRDESRVSLGPDTRLVVDRFVFAPQEQQLSFVSRMTRGTLLFVSGLISKLSPGSTEVETPTGILGVRGTRFVVHLEAPAE